MRIGSSQPLSAIHQLDRTTRAIARSLERLSSGKRVNSPRDDIATFSQSVGLDSQVRALRKSILNVNQGQSLMATADNALGSQLEILQKMRELAQQGASSSLSSIERSDLQSTMQSLMSDFQKITQETQFNGIHLLDGSFDSTYLQVGSQANSKVNFGIQSTVASQIFKQTVGTGRVKSSATFSEGTSPGSSVTRDINDDGILDIVTNNPGDNQISVRLGLGNGMFQSRATYGVNTFREILLEDIDNDGHLDIVASDDNDTGIVGVMKGVGDGTFEAAEYADMGIGTGATDIALLDLDSDGFKDIVFNDISNSRVWFALNDQNGGFQFQSDLTGNLTSTITAADFNNDGIADFIEEDGGNIYVWLGNGNATFTQSATLSSFTAISDLHVVDMNGDGIEYLLIGDTSGVSLQVRLGNGNGTFTSGTDLGVTPTLVSFGDMNNDGLMDIVYQGFMGGAPINVALNQGGNTYASAVTWQTGATITGNLSVADYDGDGVSDIMHANTGTMTILKGESVVVSGAGELNLSSAEKSSKALSVIDSAIEQIKKQKADVGAIHSRLDFTLASQALMADTLQDAKDRLVDLDFALEVAELTKLQILSDAQTAVIAQANMNLQVVLGLLSS